MRPLVIVCEATHADKVRAGLARWCHPALLSQFVLLLPVDTQTDSSFDHEKQILVEWIRTEPPGTTEHPLVCCTHTAANAMRLRSLAHAFGLEVKTESAARLAMQANSKGQSLPLQVLLNQCNLSLRSASAEMLGHWAHSRVDRTVVDQWLEQFARLGAFKWIGEEVLACTRLIEPAALGDMFGRARLADCALCVNRDPRGNPKSGEVVANVLVKRNGGATIYDSPARAIEEVGVGRLVIFEDGLWSGTEAIGVVESLIGQRDEGRLKTAPLKEAAALSRVEVTLAYGLSTDYGKALVRRFLDENRLGNVAIWSDEVVSVSRPSLLERLASGPFDLEEIRHNGPLVEEVEPHLLSSLRKRGYGAAQIEDASAFVASVGRQLFDHYLDVMCRTKNWSAWPEAKREKASLGMHGLGLTHAFGHSVPKASLPLIWGAGDVTYKGRTLKWKPLLANA